MVIEGIISKSRHKARPYSKKEGTTPMVQTGELQYANKVDAMKLSQSSTSADILARVCFNISLKRLTNPLA